MSIRMQFLGASRNVTGSRTLVEACGRRILVDCGLFQERDMQERNWDDFPVPPNSIDAVILTHAHLDHCGLLPKLVREGFDGPILCTHATADISEIVMRDSGRLQMEDAAFKKKRHEREGRKGKYPEVALYDEEDAINVLPHFKPVRFRHKVRAAHNVHAEFFEAGHILGAASVRLTIGHGKDARTLLFSGDLGRHNQPIVPDPTRFDRADLVVMESTYGDRDHLDDARVEDRLEEVIHATVKAGGNLVIPSFAVERAQDILFHLSALNRARRIPELLVFLDSPMAVRVTEIFKRHQNLFDDETRRLLASGHHPCDFPGLKIVNSVEQSKAINQIRGTAIIIAGSGMCTGGRIKHHLINNLERPESTVLFVGYQSAGTLGRRILDGEPEVRIHGMPVAVQARVERIEGFSGHAGRRELIDWAGAFKDNPPLMVFCNHGEAKVAMSFAETLNKTFGYDAVAPGYRQEFEISGLQVSCEV